MYLSCPKRIKQFSDKHLNKIGTAHSKNISVLGFLRRDNFFPPMYLKAVLTVKL
jgi:hypothetical protein